MTRALRTRHRRVTTALALLLPLAVLLVLALRPSPPPVVSHAVPAGRAEAR